MVKHGYSFFCLDDHFPNKKNHIRKLLFLILVVSLNVLGLSFKKNQ